MERCNFTAYFLHPMKGLKSLHIFLAAAAVAFLLPACGGGDDSGDYYISPRQFVNGAKAFRISAAGIADISGGTYFQDMGPGQLSEFNVDAGKDDEGYYAYGTMTVRGGNPEEALIGYYVKGGPTGEGYMTINFLESVQSPVELANFLGCLDPSDVRYAGIADNSNIGIEIDGKYVAAFLVPAVSRILLISMKGIRFKITYHFSQGMCDIVLVYAAGYAVADDEGNETGEDVVSFKDVIKLTVPYFAVPSGSQN